MKHILYFLICLCVAFSQGTHTLSGFVYDKSNHESLIGVNVYIQELGLGNITNNEGYYVITDIPEGTYTVTVDYIGYRTLNQSFKFNGEKHLKKNFFISENTMSSEVVDVVADADKKKIEVMFDKPISKIEMSAKTIEQIPQVVEADLLRSLQTLPGITSVSDFSSAIYVRGGTPDQNLYLIDGADVYNPEHAFGLFSTFNTDAIKNAELFKGGFTAEYGGRLSSVLDVINIDGNREEFEGTATVSLLAARTTLQFPLGSKGSISASIRRTYFDKVLGGTIKEIPNYYFYDGNIKAFYSINEKNTVSLSFFGGKDDLDQKLNKNSSTSSSFLYNWGNKSGSLKWTHIFAPNLYSNIWINASRYDSEFNLFDGIVTEKNRINDLTFKGTFVYDYSQYFQFKLGAEQKNIDGTYKQQFPDGQVDVPFDRKQYTGFVSASWKPNVRWDIEAGARYTHFDSEKQFSDIGPRLSIKYKYDEQTNLKLSTGRYFQYLHRIPRMFFADIWTSADKYQDQSSSDHYIAGLQRTFLDGKYDIEVEGYYKTYKNIYRFDRFTYDMKTDTYTPDGKPIYSSTDGLFHRGDGNSYGVEFIARKNKGFLTGWLGYTYSKTEHTFDGINKENAYAPRHDKSHLINAVVNLNYTRWNASTDKRALEKGESEWIYGINFIYSSGQPITVPSSMYHTNKIPGQIDFGDSFNLYPSKINSFRLPAYIRMDVSVKYKLNYNGWSMMPYLQVFNIGNRKNVWFINYSLEAEQKNGKQVFVQKVEKTTMFPLLPTLGVTFNF